MNRIFGFIFIFVITSITNIISQNYINKMDDVTKYVSDHPVLKHGRWSVYAVNTASGKIIADYESEKIMYPASNLKLVTSAVALDKLGSEYVMNTFVEYDGEINSKGELIGNLFIRGEGDPTLGSTEMEGVVPYDTLFSDWVDKLKKNGITKISGNIIADDSYLDYMPIPGGWAWTDIGNYYAAGASGLCINENLYHLYFKPSNTVGDKAIIIRTEPQIQDLKFINHMKTGKKGSGDNGYIYAAPWQYKHQLEGTVPAGVKEFSIKGAMPDPAKFAVEYFKKICIKNGITISGDAITIREHSTNQKNKKLLFINHSPPLKDIVYRLNKKSVNLFAEQLLKLIGKKFNNVGSYESGLMVNKTWLKKNGISTDNLFLLDGSGLTRYNGVTTKFLVELLVIMANKSSFPDFYNSLPIAGDPDDIGGIKKLCIGSKAAKNLWAKTGGHYRVRAHSGYVYNQSGELICFSMIANDYKGSSKKIDKLHEKIMTELSE